MKQAAILLPDPTDVPHEQIPPLMAQLAAVQTALAARLVTAADAAEPAARDRLLTAEEAAGKLNTTADWLYRNKKKLPFFVLVGQGQVRFSEQGIERWIRQQAGR